MKRPRRATAALAGGEPPTFETILYEKRDWRATITINRPKALNSINLVAFQEISQALQDAAWDDRVAVVVVTGTGDRAFCSGADLKEHWELCQRPRDYWKWINEFILMQSRLLKLGKPTIARLNGLVLGAGNEINLACDLAVACEDVVIRQAGPKVGSVPAIGVTQWLPIVVGDRRARAAMLLCEDIPAPQALEWGLVNEVVARAELDVAIDRMVDKLVDTFGESSRYTKIQTNFWKELVWAATAAHAGEWLAVHSGSVETYEGMQAFLRKQPADRIGLRRRAGEDDSPEFHWGPPVRSCASCGAENLPAHHRYCGTCGAGLIDEDDEPPG
jgi:enoyl-CoA hydratase/carnithine racemase